jgi:hypothetical protein
VADRRGIGFGWLQAMRNAWLLLHARLKILTRAPPAGGRRRN